jgi:hypothetical protein
VPTTYTQNSLTADAVAILSAGKNSEIQEHNISFSVSDPTTPATSTSTATTVSALPQTGADIPSWYGLAIFILPALSKLRYRSFI